MLSIIIITITILMKERTIMRTREEVMKIMVMIITVTNAQDGRLERKENLIRARNWSR